MLHLAIQQGDLEMVRVLLNAGALADAILTVAQEDSTLKGTALHLAVERESLEIVTVLLDDGANPNSPMAKMTGNHTFSGTALHAAVMLKHTGIVRALLEAGANTGPELTAARQQAIWLGTPAPKKSLLCSRQNLRNDRRPNNCATAMSILS